MIFSPSCFRWCAGWLLVALFLGGCGVKDRFLHWISDPYAATGPEESLSKIAVVTVEVRHPTRQFRQDHPETTVQSTARTYLGSLNYEVRDEMQSLIEDIWRYNESRISESNESSYAGQLQPFFGMVVLEILELAVYPLGERFETKAVVKARLIDVSSLRRIYVGEFSRTISHDDKQLEIQALAQATEKALSDLPDCVRQVSEADIRQNEKAAEAILDS